MNWQKVQLLLESIQKNMDCPICLEIMKNPVTTSCNHHFCNFCISKFLNTKRYVPCPMCKVLLSRRSLRENTKLKNIIDKVNKLVSAIEIDTGWTYTPAAKNQTLLTHDKKQSTNGMKRKIPLEDSNEVLHENNRKNTRFGKRRKSSVEKHKDKDTLCYDSSSPGLTVLDAHDSLNEFGLEPHSLCRRGSAGCVTPSAIGNEKKRKDKFFAKEESPGNETKPKTLASKNLQFARVCPSVVGGTNSPDKSHTLEAQRFIPTDSLNTNSVTPTPMAPGRLVSPDKENSGSAVISNSNEAGSADVSQARHHMGRYNFRRKDRCPADNSVVFKESSRSVQKIQTGKHAALLKNSGDLTETAEKFGDQAVLDSINQNHHKNIGTASVSPQKSRSRMACQSSPDISSCVVFGEMLTTDSDSRFVRVELTKRGTMISETGTKSEETVSGANIMHSLNTNIENLPKMKISQIEPQNKQDRSSWPNLDCDDADDCFAMSADLKITNSKPGPSRQIVKDPFDQRISQNIPYSVLVWSSDSEDDSAAVKKSKEPSFKWSVEQGNLKTYSRKREPRKNRAKIARWLRLLPNNFINIEDRPDPSKDAELNATWLPLSSDNAEICQLDSQKESKTDQRQEQNLLQDCSLDSSPFLSISQLENHSQGISNAEKVKFREQRLSIKLNDKNSLLQDCCHKQLDHVPKIGDPNLHLNKLEEKNSNSFQNEEMDLSITTNEKIADILVDSLETSNRFKNVSMCGLSATKEKRAGQLVASKCPVKGEILLENQNPFEFIESPKVVKLQNEKKGKRSRKSSNKMPELSFQNRLTRSFQKHLGFRNSAADVLPPAQGAPDQNVVLEELQDKISARKEPISKGWVDLETLKTSRNHSCPQEKSEEHLTAHDSKMSEKEKEAGVLKNPKQSLFPDKNNSADKRSSGNSSIVTGSDGMVLDVCKTVKQQVASGGCSKVDRKNSDNHKTSRSGKKLQNTPDLKSGSPLASKDHQIKSGQRRRSRCSSKANDKVSEELEILELVNQISSAEEYSFFFNSQDVCKSFDASVDNQGTSGSDGGSISSNNSCDRSSDTVTCNVTDGTETENRDENAQVSQVGSKTGVVINNNARDGKRLSQESIGYTGCDSEEMEMSLLKRAGKNKGNFDAEGTAEYFPANELALECNQKNFSTLQQNKADETWDEFIKPAGISVLRRGELSKKGTGSLKKDLQALTWSSSASDLEKSKLVESQALMSVSSASSLLQRKDIESEMFLEVPRSGKDSEREHLGSAETVSCRTNELLPKIECAKNLHSGSRIQGEKTADSKTAEKKAVFTNSELQKSSGTVSIDDEILKVIDSIPVSLFQKQQRNCQESERYLNHPTTSGGNANCMAATDQLNDQESGSVFESSKNPSACNAEVTVTPVVIPESPFSDVTSPNPSKSAMGNPALQHVEQRNKVVQFSDHVIFIGPQNLDEEKETEDAKEINQKFSYSVEKAGFKNSGSADLERRPSLQEHLCDEPKKDDLKSDVIAGSSKLNGFSDVDDEHFTLCASDAERRTLTECSARPSEFHANEECLVNKSESFEKATVQIAQTEESELRQKSNLRFCRAAVSSLTDSFEHSQDEGVSINTRPIESSSQRWMNEDLLPLAELTADQIRDPSKAATNTEGVINDGWYSFTANPEALPRTIGNEQLLVQDQDGTECVVTHQHEAHLPGNYHHLNDDFPCADQSQTRVEKCPDQKDDLMATDEESEGHSSGTEDININPDPSEFEPPDLAIQPEIVKKLISDMGITNLITKKSARFDMSSTELDKNEKVATDKGDQDIINMGPLNQNLEKYTMLTRSKTSLGTMPGTPSPDPRHKSLKKKSAGKKSVTLSRPSSQENTDNLESGASSNQSSQRANLGSDETLCESLVSPCQILCYSLDNTTKECPKPQELPSKPKGPEPLVSKISDSKVQVLPNVQLVDYDISQNSRLSETDSDSAIPLTQLVGRRTRSRSRLQHQLPKSPKACKLKVKETSQKTKSTNSLRNSKQDPAIYGECSKDLEKELGSLKMTRTLARVDSWLTMTDNLDSMTVLKSQDSTPSKTNDSSLQELVLTKSGIDEIDTKNLTVTESENFSLSSAERKFLGLGLDRAGENSDRVEVKDQIATSNRKETDYANLMKEETSVFAKREAWVLAENLDCPEFGKLARSASQDVSSSAPSVVQSLENLLDDDNLSENTLEPTQLSIPDNLRSSNQPDFVLKKQDNDAVSKKQPVLPSEILKNDSVDVPSTETMDFSPIASLTDPIIPDSVEPTPADAKESANGSVPNLLTSNQNASQKSNTSYVPCSVEQDGTLVHVLEVFQEVYTRNQNTASSDTTCAGAGSQSKNSIRRISSEIAEDNQKNSQRSMSMISEDAVVKMSAPSRDGNKSCTADKMVVMSDHLQDNSLQVENDIVKGSPLGTNSATLAISCTSKIAFSTECHLKIDSQNFIPVKRSKRKCFSLGGSVQESPTKPKAGNQIAKPCASSAVIQTNPADSDSLDVKSATKGLSFSPTATKKSQQARRKLPSRFDKLEKEENGKLQEMLRVSLQENGVLKESNSFESCVLLSTSQIEEFVPVSTEDISVCNPKQNRQFLENELVNQLRSIPNEQSLDLSSVSKRKRSKKTLNLSGSSQSPRSKSGNRNSGSDTGIEERVNSQQSVSSLSSTNDNCRLRSSSRLHERNKSIAKKQKNKTSLEIAKKQESLSSKPREIQRKFLLKNSDSSNIDLESLQLSPNDSDTQQPSCPFLSADDMEAENTIISNSPEDDNTATTQAPSLDFSDCDKMTVSPHRELTEISLGLESVQRASQELLQKNGYNSDREETVGKVGANGKEAENVLELSEKEAHGLQDNSQGAASSSSSTKCPSSFSASVPSSQRVSSNVADSETIETDSSENGKQKSRVRSIRKVHNRDESTKVSGQKGTSRDIDPANVIELSQMRLRDRSVDKGFAMAKNNQQLTTESGNGQILNEIDPMENIDLSLPDLPEVLLQEFYPETNSDGGQNNPDDVSNTSETSPIKKVSEDKYLESSFAEKPSQEIGDKMRKMPENQINSLDTKMASQANSCEVNDDAVIVIDELPSGEEMATRVEVMDCDAQSPYIENKNIVINDQTEAVKSCKPTTVSAESLLDENLHNKRDITDGEQSKDEEGESLEEFPRQRVKKSKCHIINDDSDDDDDEKVEVLNLECISASSPSALSTQSEKFSTQQCSHLEQDLEEMKKQIAQLEARLGLNDSVVDIACGEEAAVQVQVVPDKQELPALAKPNIPPGADKRTVIKGVTKEEEYDKKYTALSSSDDDEEEDLDRGVIPDSDPDENNGEQNISTIFSVQKHTVRGLHSSGEESEDLFCTPGSPVSLPQLPTLCRSRHKQAKEVEGGRSIESPYSKNQVKDIEVNRKSRRKNGTSKSSRLRITSSSSSEDDMEVAAGKTAECKVLHSKAEVNKEGGMSVKLDNKKDDSFLNLEELSCISAKTSTKLPRNNSGTPPKAKITPRNKSLGSKELSVTNTADAAVKNQSKKTKCFIATGLSNIEVNQIKKLASLIGGQFLLTFSRKVTHVIVKTVSEKVRHCDRTLKYFLGIANKSWILPYKWIQDSLEKKRLLKEEPYEIIGDSVNGYAHRGPTRSRLSHVPLFKQFEIHVVGESCELTKDQLKNLITMTGGCVVEDIEEFGSNPCITSLVVASSNQNLTEFRRLKSQLKIYNILLISREWILDSVAMFQVQPLEGYIQLT